MGLTGAGGMYPRMYPWVDYKMGAAQASGTSRITGPLKPPRTPKCHLQYNYWYMRPAWLSRYSSHHDGQQASIGERKAGLVPWNGKGDAHGECPTGLPALDHLE